MMNQYVMATLIYLAISLFITVAVSIINPKHMRNHIVPVFLISLISVSIGGTVYTAFQQFFDALSSLQNVNIYPPLISGILSLWIFNRVLTHNDD
ncbi:hypothetical protein [Spirochaeta dissipatitropha]